MRGPLVQARLAVAVVSGLAVFWLGVGAAFAPRVVRFKYILSILTAASMLLGVGAIPFIFKNPIQHPTDVLPLLWYCVPLVSLPMLLLGTTLGIIYQESKVEEDTVAGTLVAASTSGFLFGFVGANFLVSTLGIWTSLAASAAIPLLLSRPLFSGTLAALTLVVFPLLGLDAKFETISAPAPYFWIPNAQSQHKHLYGAWSPYSRVDFYRAPDGSLAGLYNGSQQWTVSAKPEEDFLVRYRAYATFNGDVLLIGAGGGHGVVDLTSADTVTAVELDPVVVETLSGPLAEYNNNVYRRHETIAGDGRSYLETTDKTFDYVILEGTDITVSRLQHSVISFENTLYTEEGILAAASRLKPRGVLIAGHAMDSQPTVRFISGLPKDMHWAAWRGMTSRKGTPFPARVVAASYSKERMDEFKI